MRKLGLLPIYIATLLWILVMVVPMSLPARSPGVTPSPGLARTAPRLSVVTVGGSVAHGWDDKAGGGFLHRTFQTLNATTSVTYAVYDKTIIGANAVQLQDTLYKGDYEKWLGWFRPNVVLISWGLLNDCLPNTPMPVFQKYLGQEITEALRHKAVVFIVTPPVTRASYTKYKTQEQAYVDKEISLVRSMRNPNVRIFDVYDEMKRYLTTHHQTYMPYMSNGWHPNSAGHALAAQLLVQDISGQYGDQPPKFRPGT